MEYVASRTQRNPLGIVLFSLYVVQDAIICLLLWRNSLGTPLTTGPLTVLLMWQDPKSPETLFYPPVGHMYLTKSSSHLLLIWLDQHNVINVGNQYAVLLNI